MSDVRSLLRNERASRRIDHPNASYTATGKLECSVCRIPLKSDAEVWNKHLKSTQHAMRAERQRLNQTTATSSNHSSVPASTQITINHKKRKVRDEEDDSRKRTRPVISPGLSSNEPVESNDVHPPESEISRAQASSSVKDVPPTQEAQGTVDEDEWAAFQRDLATPPPDEATAPLPTQAVISAAPISAADLAAQEKERERESGKERREAEMEAEKEDATRALEEEFEEMEGLEERLRRLKEKREELRRRRIDKSDEAVDSTAQIEEVKEAELQTNEEDESSGDDDFDEWGFGR